MKSERRAGVKMAKMSLKTKIAMIIAIVAVAAVAVVLLVILTNGNAEPASDQDLEAAAYEEEEEAVVDESGQPGEDQRGDDAVYGYSDISTAIADVPKAAALDKIYILLEGFWITEDNPVVGFIFEDGKHAIEFGLFQTGYGYRGVITDGRATGKFEAELVITVSAVPATEMDDAIPESKEMIYIDIGGLYEPENTIRVKTEKLDSGNWNTYRYGALTIDQAFDVWYY